MKQAKKIVSTEISVLETPMNRLDSNSCMKGIVSLLFSYFLEKQSDFFDLTLLKYSCG